MSFSSAPPTAKFNSNHNVGQRVAASQKHTKLSIHMKNQVDNDNAVYPDTTGLGKS